MVILSPLGCLSTGSLNDDCSMAMIGGAAYLELRARMYWSSDASLEMNELSQSGSQVRGDCEIANRMKQHHERNHTW